MTQSARTFSILAVCTGNICRSPTMERLLITRLTQRDANRGIRVSSAGTWGLVGEPMSELAAQCLVDLGGDPTGFSARELTPALMESADLVLCATRDHRAEAVTMMPRAASKTLTWLEFARLLSPISLDQVEGKSPSKRCASLLVLALSQRGLVPINHPRDDDIGDPYGSALPLYQETARQIDKALNSWLDLLAPPITP